MRLPFGIVPTVSAMHIMEGYLPGRILHRMGCPVRTVSHCRIHVYQKNFKRTPKSGHPAGYGPGAFVFVISSLKIPSVTGSCSHMTGTGLGAILFGPSAVSILGLIVLLFQAILLAHGGLTTIGANTFSMAIAGPFVSYGLYVVLKRPMWIKKSVYFWPHF